ncbi:hypothetical protein J6590_054082 [Homalodisca vitripennis]|nr:hypothetical protein J6590_054082 [Homalodisca vitripennis]
MASQFFARKRRFKGSNFHTLLVTLSEQIGRCVVISKGRGRWYHPTPLLELRPRPAGLPNIKVFGLYQEEASSLGKPCGVALLSALETSGEFSRGLATAQDHYNIQR